MAEPFILEEATVAGLHKAMTEGNLTCEELVRAYIRRIEEYDKVAEGLNAVIALNPDALADAKRLDRDLREKGLTGPLHGVPVLIKDNLETVNMPTTAGSKSLEGWRSGRDATVVRRLKEAGAVILAKTNLHEFAVWGETVSSILGQTRNPYDKTRTPGGSSGGTGAAVAANFGLAGIGTDTVNSIRSPASACSLCGIRPTVGLVSRFGVVPYSLTQDTAGPITRTVEDGARILDAIAGADPLDPATQGAEGKIPGSYTDYLRPDGLKGKRLGVLRSLFGKEEIHQEVNTAMEKALARMEAAGAMIISVMEPIDTVRLVKEVSVHIHDLKTHLGDYLASFGENVPVHSVGEILESGKYTPDIEENLKQAQQLGVGAGDYALRMEKREELRRLILRIMEENSLDALVYPHQQQLVCKTGGSQQQRNGVIGAVTGFPAISVPGGFSCPAKDAPIGVPIGVEFLGRPFDEGRLIGIAYGFEQSGPIRKPPVLK